jgi:peptidyl-prolyl cis-trans isomerase SurA
MMLKRLSLSALAGALLVAAAGAAAQQGDPRIAAIVNREAISLYDVEQRVRLIGLTQRLPDNPEQRRRIVQDTLRTMINERLQVQEARRLGLDVDDSEVEESVQNLESRNRMGKGGLDKLLRGRGIDPRTLRDQLRASIAWGKVVQRIIRPQVRVGDDEVKEVVERYGKNKDKLQYRVFEIYLPVDSAAREAEVLRQANEILNQIRRGQSFEIMARQYSQSGTASSGGDMGFLFEGQMEPEIERAVKTMKSGQVIGPVRGAGGFFILLLADRRALGGANPDVRTARVAQALFPIAEPRRPADVAAAQQKAATVVKAAKDCEAFVAAARENGAPDSRITDDVVIERLPPNLRGVLAPLKPGQLSRVITTPTDVAVFMMCAGSVRGAPTDAEVREALTRQRVSAAAERYLRELRRSAFVDIRA